ncbi:MAG: hypothetical protein JOZ54_23460 [Acidobacteria bacterium]|nr:hypothetical protein [Acidobacteriota bacterium]
MASPTLHRGIVFRAEHDSTFESWGSEEPRAKFCVVFNAEPAIGDADVHYFMCTSKVARLRETPSLHSDILFLEAGAYACFSLETAIDFRTLYVVPLPKLISHRMKIVGELTPADVRRCEEIVATARVLEGRAKKLLGLR